MSVTEEAIPPPPPPAANDIIQQLSVRILGGASSVTDTCAHPKSYQHPMEIMSVRVRPQVSQVSVTEEAPPQYPQRHSLYDIIGGSCHKYHFCGDESFVATNMFCCHKNNFVTTKVLLRQ